MTPRETELTRKLEETQAALARAEQENTLLRQKIDLLVRRVFGASSEHLDPAQLELLLQLPPATTPAATVAVVTPERGAVRPRPDRAPRLPDHLPVVEEVIDPEPVKAEPEQWRCIGKASAAVFRCVHSRQGGRNRWLSATQVVFRPLPHG